MLRPLEHPPLFVRDEESLDGITVAFTEFQLQEILSVKSETYSSCIGDAHGIRYWVTLPEVGEVQICRTNDQFYGSGTDLLNEYKKENPDSAAAKWLKAHASEVNVAMHYWRAVNSRKKAELLLLRANIAICEAKSFISGKWGLTSDERNLLITEYGYDPDQSYNI